MPDLHEQLRAYREAAGLTQEEVSEATGLAVGSISDWERGVRAPNVSKLNLLAQCYGATIDDILNYAPGGSPSSARTAVEPDGSSLLALVLRASDILEDASRQDPEEAKRRSTMALGIMRLATEEAQRRA